jgi:hypothetical protein
LQETHKNGLIFVCSFDPFESYGILQTVAISALPDKIKEQIAV